MTITACGKEAPAGDGNSNEALDSQISNDSIASVIFPFKNRRPPYVSRNETGRQVTVQSFYFYLMTSFLLSVGIQLIVVALWSMMYKGTFFYLIGNNVYRDPIGFMFISGFMCLPCAIIFWSMHNNKKNYLLFPILIVILGITASVLTIGTGLSYRQRSNIEFNKGVYPPVLVKNEYYRKVNHSMTVAMQEYQYNIMAQYAWDAAQRRFKCCGIESVEDWLLTTGRFPESCCVHLTCGKYDYIYNRGCIHLISFDLAWILTLTTTLSVVDLCIQLFTLLFACTMYVKCKLSDEDDEC